jgi:hypothetical protein
MLLSIFSDFIFGWKTFFYAQYFGKCALFVFRLHIVGNYV